MNGAFIFSGICIAVGLALLSSVVISAAKRSRAERDAEKTSEDAEVVELIAMTIQDHPNEWIFDGYRLSHVKLKVAIWVANDRYGLRYTTDGADVTNFGTRPTGTALDVLWEAVRFHRKWRAGNDAKAFAERVVNVFGGSGS